MEYKDFLEILMRYKKINEEFSELHKLGFDFLEGKYKLQEQVSEIFNTTIRSHFTKDGVDWIEWFIYENEYGNKLWDKDKEEGLGAKDENGNHICHSFESTWNFVKQYLK